MAGRRETRSDGMPHPRRLGSAAEEHDRRPARSPSAVRDERRADLDVWACVQAPHRVRCAKRRRVDRERRDSDDDDQREQHRSDDSQKASHRACCSAYCGHRTPSPADREGTRRRARVLGGRRSRVDPRRRAAHGVLRDSARASSAARTGRLRQACARSHALTNGNSPARSGSHRRRPTRYHVSISPLPLTAIVPRGSHSNSSASSS